MSPDWSKSTLQPLETRSGAVEQTVVLLSVFPPTQELELELGGVNEVLMGF